MGLAETSPIIRNNSQTLEISKFRNSYFFFNILNNFSNISFIRNIRFIQGV